MPRQEKKDLVEQMLSAKRVEQPYVRAVAGHTAVHYGSLGSAECGANYADMALTTVPANVTCRTCRGWLPIVAPELQSTPLEQNPEGGEGPAVCTNCGETAKPHPAYADFVGPFCEGCWDRLREHFAKGLVVDRDADLLIELRKHLDGLTITSDNIGDIRRRLFFPFDSMWNGWVRDETAVRENKL